MRKPIPKPRRHKLDIAAEYIRLGRSLKKTESRMREIKSLVASAGGRIDSPTATLAIEYAERRSAPSISDLQSHGIYDDLDRRGIIRRVHVQFLRIIGRCRAA